MQPHDRLANTMIIVHDTVSHFDPDVFDCIDPACGVTHCYHRTRQLEAEPFWTVQYIVASDDPSPGNISAVLPIYKPKTREWSNSLYDPARWGAGACAPRNTVVIGAVRDVQSCLRITHDTTSMTSLASMLDLAVEYSAHRQIVFPHYSETARAAIDAAYPGSIAWVPTYVSSQLEMCEGPAWESSLGSAARAERRSDRRLITRAGLSVRVEQWAACHVSLLDLVVDHARRLGGTDSAVAAFRRYKQWSECKGVQVLVFQVTKRSTVMGVGMALEWKDELLLYEMGLPGSRGPDRLATYLLLLSEAPVSYALEKELRLIRLGFGNEVLTSRRGGTSVPHFYGWLRTDA